MTPQFLIFPRIDGVVFEDAALSVQAFHGGRLSIATRGSFFFAVVSGQPRVNGIVMSPGTYGCLPRHAQFEGEACRVMVAETKDYTGVFTLAGPIEQAGRLRYINGCTDTGLIQPLKLGDPCLNALFFPAQTLQTPHTHPSHRVGAVFDGAGVCWTDEGPTTMRQGDIFLIPTDGLHWFETTTDAMRIMVFHPDSEFGPTDEQHQMLIATIIA